jgi:predicted metal-binding protein
MWGKREACPYHLITIDEVPVLLRQRGQGGLPLQSDNRSVHATEGLLQTTMRRSASTFINTAITTSTA